MPDGELVCDPGDTPTRPQPPPQTKAPPLPKITVDEPTTRRKTYSLDAALRKLCQKKEFSGWIFRKPENFRVPATSPDPLPSAVAKCRTRQHCGPKMIEIQMHLKALGFYPGPLDGLSGPVSTKAKRAYVCQYRLPPWVLRDAYKRLLPFLRQHSPIKT